MNISVTTDFFEIDEITQLVNFKPGVEFQVLVMISSLCILITVIPIVKYVFT